MDLLRSITGSVLIEAHRGGEGLAVENSWAAIEAGYLAGADILELDVQITRDHYPVLYHSYTLPDGRWFRDISRHEVGSLNHRNEPLVPLDDVIEWARQKPIILALDLKNGFGFDPSLFTVISDRLNQHQAAAKTIVLAWDHNGLAMLKERHRDLTTLALIRGRPVNMLQMLHACHADAVNLDADMVCKQDVDALHQAGIVVVIAEMFDPDFARAIDNGADIICCKDPSAARRAIETIDHSLSSTKSIG